MIAELELDPVDWEQLRLLAKLTPGERMMAMAQTSAFSRALLRGRFGGVIRIFRSKKST